MGAFNDLLNILRSTVGGLVPFGGTLNPVSEGIPIGFAQTIKGNLAVYPTIEALADIPYDLLSLDMEAIVREHTRPDTSTYPRTKSRLKLLPPVGTKISDNPSYVITDFWEALPEPGAGEPGVKGDAGWSPTYVLEDDGPTRVVERFFAWVGGTGTAPPAPASPNDYLGSSGFVSKSSAINVKGPTGAPGSNAQVRPDYYSSVGIREIDRSSFLSIGAPYGVFKFVSGYLTISNTWSQPRSFMIFGEVPVSNISGSWSGTVVRLYRLNNPSDLITGAVEIVDENFAYVNYVINGYYSSIHKVNVRFKTVVNPGESKYYKLGLAQVEGLSSNYKNGFIEAFGL